uniref:Putative secreted protein n=1 Tax=Ixodes ricinus TaxID=34613 RepID=A0A6B0UKM1_IXORI
MCWNYFTLPLLTKLVCEMCLRPLDSYILTKEADSYSKHFVRQFLRLGRPLATCGRLFSRARLRDAPFDLTQKRNTVWNNAVVNAPPSTELLSHYANVPSTQYYDTKFGPRLS